MRLMYRIKDLIKRIKNSGYRLSEEQLEIRRRQLIRDTTPPCVFCPHCPQIALKCPFQPTSPPPKRETNRKKHMPNWEY